jgi:hypothetical protein
MPVNLKSWLKKSINKVKSNFMALWIRQPFEKSDLVSYENSYFYTVQEHSEYINKYELGLEHSSRLVSTATELSRLLDSPNGDILRKIYTRIWEQEDEERVFIYDESDPDGGSLLHHASIEDVNEIVNTLINLENQFTLFLDAPYKPKKEIIEKLINEPQSLVEVKNSSFGEIGDNFVIKLDECGVLTHFFGKAKSLNSEILFD